MTTNYILEAQKELRHLKKMERKAEALIRVQADAAADAKVEASRAWRASKSDRVAGIATKMERARTEAGHFVADDPTTPDVNEAYVPKKGKFAAKRKSAGKSRSKK